MKESILPRMHTATQDTVLGGIIKHVNDRKMVIVLGEPGEGKTITVLDFCTQSSFASHYKKCTANTTMNSMLVFMANSLGIRVIGGNDELQERIQNRLHDDPNHCFVFDEAEYLAYGNGTKIDVLRQIYDETSVPIIICGTYVLKDLISGERKKKVTQTHNRPQIFRRLRKEEFDRIDEHEVKDYLTLLEKQYVLQLDSAVKTSLIANCRDRQSGGLGNFVEILELLFSQVRPEWETISYQMIRGTGRTLHHHTEPVQSYTSIKPTKFDDHEIKDFEEQKRIITASVQSKPDNSIDISTLSPVRVDMKMLQDVLRHKMGM